MDQPINLAVAGAGGRLGQAVLAVVTAGAGLRVAARIGRAGAQDMEGAAMDLDEALAAADVVIDVSTAQAAADLAQRCADAGKPLVVGVTGMDSRQQAAMTSASERIALLQSGNFSLGLNVLLALVRQAAEALGPAYDIEIFESHHRRKTDAPSGTALMLGRAAAEGRGSNLEALATGLDGSRSGERARGAIGFAVSRGGGVIGRHEVSLAGDREVLTLSHTALDRTVFAEGAVHAARWLVGRPPGLYAMTDVLFASH